jgi:hypothetical protein
MRRVGNESPERRRISFSSARRSGPLLQADGGQSIGRVHQPVESISLQRTLRICRYDTVGMVVISGVANAMPRLASAWSGSGLPPALTGGHLACLGPGLRFSPRLPEKGQVFGRRRAYSKNKGPSPDLPSELLGAACEIMGVHEPVPRVGTTN